MDTALFWMLATVHDVRSEYITIPCATRTGTSQISCHSAETMVSCGISADGIQGTWIDNNVCTAYPDDKTAMARCCTFPSDAISNVVTISSVNGRLVNVTCPTDAVLTGCDPRYVSGTTRMFKGSWVGSLSSPPQSASWIPTDNQCHAESWSIATLKAGARCLSLNPQFSLECQTKAILTDYSNFGQCEAGYSMMACNAWTDLRVDTSNLDLYYVNGDDACMVRQYNFQPLQANAICCRLTQDPTITANPTAKPTVDPTINPTNYPSNYPSKNPSRHSTNVPTMNPSIDPTTNAPTKAEVIIAPTNDPTTNTSTTDPSFYLTDNPTMDTNLENELEDQNGDDIDVIVKEANDRDDTEPTEENASWSVIISIVIAVVIFILIAAIIYCKRQQNNKPIKPQQDGNKAMKDNVKNPVHNQTNDNEVILDKKRKSDLSLLVTSEGLSDIARNMAVMDDEDEPGRTSSDKLDDMFVEPLGEESISKSDIVQGTTEGVKDQKESFHQIYKENAKDNNIDNVENDRYITKGREDLCNVASDEFVIGGEDETDVTTAQ